SHCHRDHHVGNCVPSSDDFFVLEEALQLAGLEHLADDVATANKFTAHIKLRNGGPVGEGLDSFADFHVLHHIDGVKGHVEMIQNLHHGAGKTAHGKLGVAFHKQHHIVCADFFLNHIKNGRLCRGIHHAFSL